MADKQNTRKIVLTGGPGVGKTTLVGALATKGHKVVPEAARIVIEKELQNPDTDCLPWKNVRRFQEEVLKLQLQYESQHSEGIIFLDRGIIDGYAYSQLGRVLAPEAIPALARNRYHQVFLIEPLSIFENDCCRKENTERAAEIHRAIEIAYQEFGYRPIRVPALPPIARADFILNQIQINERGCE